jgi:hypothetical protein
MRAAADGTTRQAVRIGELGAANGDGVRFALGLGACAR